MSFLFLAQIMVGINIVLSKVLLSVMPIFLLLIIRFALAVIILLPLHWFTAASKIPLKTHFSTLKRKDWFYILAQSLCAGVLFNCLMLAGLHYTDANIAGIITSSLPAIIAIMSWLILGERISSQKSLCIVFATIGLAIIAASKLTTIGENHSFLGDFIVLLSLLPEAAYYVLCKLHPNKSPVFLISALMNGINTLALIPVLFFLPEYHQAFSSMNIFILFILGLTSGMFYVFWNFGCQRVDGILTSLSTAIMPVATVIFAWVILGEQLTLVQCVGMCLVIFSIALYARR